MFYCFGNTCLSTWCNISDFLFVALLVKSSFWSWNVFLSHNTLFLGTRLTIYRSIHTMNGFWPQLLLMQLLVCLICGSWLYHCMLYVVTRMFSTSCMILNIVAWPQLLFCILKGFTLLECIHSTELSYNFRNCLSNVLAALFNFSISMGFPRITN
jgi:hypothetical protein